MYAKPFFRLFVQNLYRSAIYMKKSVIGILAHVDAGKTTLAESILYNTGTLRSQGRVDKGDTLLDTHHLEKERGITIFASGAVFQTEKSSITLLDTPGHVDFSSETERVLQVLDYAILVISGIDGVQAHTRTLWRLLKLYNIPVFIFVTKMDFARRNKDDILTELQNELDSTCIDFTFDNSNEFYENLAVCSENALDEFLDYGTVQKENISVLIRSRKTFPCYFGSGLKNEGVTDFLNGIDKYISEMPYPAVFGAKVYKISHDKQGNRLTHIKVTGGKLKVKDTVTTGENDEKINQIRIYSGEKFTTVEEVCAGDVCALTGLLNTENGQGLGYESSSEPPYLEPVMNYRIVLPDGCDSKTMFPKLKALEEEDPMLHITWNSFLQEIHVGLMGEVQTEILKSLIFDRFETEVKIDNGRILYKETIEEKTEGVGHYEPLRHYAEVHLILEPLPRGTGLRFSSICSENAPDKNWQRLILMHLKEKEHLGVLTGSPITDMKITLAAGRAHLKHTEGGDFRQATYRAVRNGLMNAESVILEPYCKFRLEVPFEQLGRAINDIRMRSGTFSQPENFGETALLKGKIPVATINGYSLEVASYTGGRGRLICENAGYDKCHNPEEVLKEFNYSPESDLENSPDSVFCAHGAGFVVKWDKVSEYMHIESCLNKENNYVPQIRKRNLHIDDKELKQIMERIFGKHETKLYRSTSQNTTAKADEDIIILKREEYIIVDGYNVIFAWDSLNRLAKENLEDARNSLTDILCNFAAFTEANIILVFDAYRVSGNNGKQFDCKNIHIAYTKENELADVYISKLISDIGKNDKVRVVTSDRLIQLSAVNAGVLRVSANEFLEEVEAVNEKITEAIKKLNNC